MVRDIRSELRSDKVILDKDASIELVNYGRKRNDLIELSLEEAAYLLERAKISVLLEKKELDFESFVKKASKIAPNFELKYLVYKDLRERGYFVHPGTTDFRVYPRGGSPGTTPAEYFVQVISEREPLGLETLIKELVVVENVRKRLILAIVDEESDITFYEVTSTLFGEAKESKDPGSVNPVAATLLQDRVVLWDQKISNDLFNLYFFGKLLDEKRLQLSLVESLYLLQIGLINLVGLDDQKIKIEDFFKYATSIEPDFAAKYKVYEDLRKRGLSVKTGFKFGTHFRVYDGMKDTHSRFLVHAIPAEHVFSLQEMSRAIRLSHSVRKKMVFAYDLNHNIGYIGIGRVKL
ncbi:MAG: tRNA-intron lyase, partial [Halobacteriota archaeon]|nr:tRNA-intron lyase [Halobacteriota archaeon]